MECLVYQSVKKSGIKKEKIKKGIFSLLFFLKKKGDLSVHLVSEKKIKELNNTYRGRDSITDVLSFAAQEGDLGQIEKSEELGDIFICVEQVKRQAKECNVLYEEEFFRMLIHGVLHLLGYDHLNKVQADKMFKLQEQFLKKIL